MLDHLIGVPLAIASQDYAHAIWKTFDEIPALQAPEVRRIQGRVVHIDCEAKSARIEGVTKGGLITEEQYDYLVACSGLHRDWPSAPKSLTREDYMAEATGWVQDVKKASQGVVVIGGGMYLPPITPNLLTGNNNEECRRRRSRDRGRDQNGAAACQGYLDSLATEIALLRVLAR